MFSALIFYRNANMWNSSIINTVLNNATEDDRK